MLNNLAKIKPTVTHHQRSLYKVWPNKQLLCGNLFLRIAVNQCVIKTSGWISLCNWRSFDYRDYRVYNGLSEHNKLWKYHSDCVMQLFVMGTSLTWKLGSEFIFNWNRNLTLPLKLPKDCMTLTIAALCQCHACNTNLCKFWSVKFKPCESCLIHSQHNQVRYACFIVIAFTWPLHSLHFLPVCKYRNIHTRPN